MHDMRDCNRAKSRNGTVSVPVRLVSSTAGLAAGTRRRMEDEMGLILWLIIGGVVGWLASIIMRTDAQQGIVLNIVVGIVGAFIGGLVFTGGTINNAGLSLYTFLTSLVGAIVLLAIVNLVRRGSVR